VLDAAIKTQRDAEDRTGTISKGRRAMEDMTRQIRSQMCLDKLTVPIIEARPNKIEFYGALLPATAAPTYQRRTLQYIADADGTRGRIDESVVTATGTPGSLAWTAPAVTRTLITGVKPPAAGLFRFWTFEAETAPALREVTADPVSQADRQLTVQVGVKYDVLPDRGRPVRSTSSFENTVFVRTADPTDPTRSPKCT
jgi:hypothetical protein